jgi:hypothetical protein
MKALLGDYVSVAVEGDVDEAVAIRLIVLAGGVPGSVYGKRGKPGLRRGVTGYNQAARRAPWLVLVDLDTDEPCAPTLLRTWLPDQSAHMCFRVAVRAIEAWLIADPERLAGFLGISASRIPAEPEGLVDPKRTMVDLARTSRRRDIQNDMVPREGSGRSVGPAYTSRVIEYARDDWRPDVAARRAESLQRAIACLEELIRRV